MYKIVDTNVFLIDASNLMTLGADGSTLVIPETVIDEIDDKKSVPGDIGYQAREFGRSIANSHKVGIIPMNEDLTAVKYNVKGTTVLIVALTGSKYEDRDNMPLSVYNDRKIIQIAKYFKDSGIFVSNDVMCRTRAEIEGLQVTDFKYIESVKFEFVKEITVSEDIFISMHRKPILDIYPEHKHETYNYIVSSPSTNEKKIGTVINGIFEVLGKETEKELKKQDISPINAGQKFFAKALQEQSINLVVCEALSGSGKTAVAISNGIKLVKQGKYSSIMYVRASVDDVDDIETVGFLPGLEEKFAVYLHPLTDTLDFIARNKFKDSKTKGEAFEEKVEQEIESMKNRYNITAQTGLGMRGRTFTNTYIIIDEAQNQSNASLQKMLTRIGKDCKTVVIGSLRQIDNKYLTKYTSGLSTLLNAAKEDHEKIRMHAASLDKVVRSNMAEFAETLFSDSK